MIASCGCRVKSYRAKQANGKWFCPPCYSEYMNQVFFYKSMIKHANSYCIFVRYKVDGKIESFTVVGSNKGRAEARALSLLPEWLWEKFNGIL